MPSNNIRDIIHDTRSDGLFVTYDDEGIRFLTVNPLTTTSISSPATSVKCIAMVDFIHCSGPIYGLLIAFQVGYKISFLPLTPASPPVGGTIIDVAGDGTDMNADGVGSAARFKGLGYITCANTAPVWLIGGWQTESIRRAVFTGDVPLSLNVTTILSTPGKKTFGAATTRDDSILYVSMNNLQEILIVLNPLSSSPTAGATLSIAAPLNMHKIALHPACETVLLVGGSGGALVLYNVTSQSIIHTLTAVASASHTLAGTLLANGTVLFAAYSTAPNALVSWCCLSPYDSSTLPAYAPSVPAITLPGSSSYTQDLVHDTRSDGLFLNRFGTGIQYLRLDPFSNTAVYAITSAIQSAMVDFIHCSGPIYGILMALQSGYKMSFLPLTPAAPGVPTRCGQCHRRCW